MALKRTELVGHIVKYIKYMIKKLIKTGLWSEHLQVARDKVYFFPSVPSYTYNILFASSISHILNLFVRHGIYIERCVMCLYLATQKLSFAIHKIYTKQIYIYMYICFFPILRMSILQHYYYSSSCLCYFTRKFVSSIIWTQKKTPNFWAAKYIKKKKKSPKTAENTCKER